MLGATFLVIALNWTQPGSSGVDDRLQKQWSVHSAKHSVTERAKLVREQHDNVAGVPGTRTEEKTLVPKCAHGLATLVARSWNGQVTDAEDPATARGSGGKSVVGTECRVGVHTAPACAAWHGFVPPSERCHHGGGGAKGTWALTVFFLTTVYYSVSILK